MISRCSLCRKKKPKIPTNKVCRDSAIFIDDTKRQWKHGKCPDCAIRMAKIYKRRARAAILRG